MQLSKAESPPLSCARRSNPRDSFAQENLSHIEASRRRMELKKMKLKLMKLAGIMGLLASPFGFAQGADDFKPATSNVLDAQYRGRQQVTRADPVQGARREQSQAEFLERSEGGHGEGGRRKLDVYTPPMAPGLHYYTIIVDGAEVSDPGSTAYFGGSKWASAVEVPEAERIITCLRTFRTDRCAKFGTTQA